MKRRREPRPPQSLTTRRSQAEFARIRKHAVRLVGMHGNSMAKASVAMGINEDGIRRVLDQNTSCTAEFVRKLAAALGTTPEEIVKE